MSWWRAKKKQIGEEPALSVAELRSALFDVLQERSLDGQRGADVWVCPTCAHREPAVDAGGLVPKVSTKSCGR
jgi:hypothetical protein